MFLEYKIGIDIYIVNCINISQYYSSDSIFYKINAALVSLRDFLKNIYILNGSVHVNKKNACISPEL